MKGLKVKIQEIHPNTGQKWTDYLILGILITIALGLLPLILIFWLLGLIFNLLFPNNKLRAADTWIKIKTESNLELKYRWVDNDKIPDFLYSFSFDDPIIEFHVSPVNEFFNGYFTSLIVERSDGIFVQKIILNQKQTHIVSMPLYFFSFLENGSREIVDLKGYETEIKGPPDDFIISAIGKENELEISLKK